MKRKFEHLSQGEYLYVEDEIAAAERSLYFWWWRYLRLSQDYWWLCRQNGKCSDKKFAQTYSKFGDVFRQNFQDWWMDKGIALFGSDIHPYKVEWATNSHIWLSGQTQWLGIIIVPLFKTKSELRKQFSDLIKSHVQANCDAHRPSVSAADMNSLKGVRRKVIEDAHKVWCLNELISHLKITGQLEKSQKYTQLWVGKKADLELRRNYERYKTNRNLANERLAMRVKVCRYIAKANCLISNVEIGSFPNFTMPEKTKRWTKKQELDLASAVAAGEWRSEEFLNRENLKLFDFDNE